jgi:hypothetical protein
MAGIKISELNKWSYNDLEGLDGYNILIPVSINNVTGALRADTLVNLLKETGSDVDDIQDAAMDELRQIIATLTARLAALETDVNRKYQELIEAQQNIDNQQNSQINEHSETIENIEEINDQQSQAISDLQDSHGFDTYEEETPNP